MRSPEAMLSCIWRDVLSVEQLSVGDSFFKLGGNSLLGLRLAAQVSKCFGVKVDTHTIIQFPTIRQMAELVDRLLSVTDDAEMEESAI